MYTYFREWHHLVISLVKVLRVVYSVRDEGALKTVNICFSTPLAACSRGIELISVFQNV
jgi:hypothetical protein